MALSTLFDDTGFTPRPTANPVAVAFTGAARAVAVWRAGRIRHGALIDLLGMEPHRLHDLGISTYDLREALRGRSGR